MLRTWVILLKFSFVNVEHCHRFSNDTIMSAYKRYAGTFVFQIIVIGWLV